MPKFRVKGCFKENAEDVEIILEATSYKHAERIANEKGILVSDVLTVGEPSAKHPEPAVLSSAPSKSKKKSDKDQKNVLLPHRGQIILNLGILSTLCLCFPAGVGAWICADKDIKLMKCNKMDSDGLFKTRAGKVLGILSVILFCFVTVPSILDSKLEPEKEVVVKEEKNVPTETVYEKMLRERDEEFFRNMEKLGEQVPR